VKRIKRIVRRLDSYQQAHPRLAFVFAVNKKAGDDNSGLLIANLAYVGFLSVFPLLLLAVTVLGILVGRYPGIRHAVQQSIVVQFPIIGTELIGHVTALHRASVAGLVVGIVGLVWGATGLSQAGMFAMAQVWTVPGVDRPGYLKRLIRSFEFLALLATSVVVTGYLSVFGTFGKASALGVASELGSVLVNVAAYLLAFRILTPRRLGVRDLIWGAVVGGIAWTILQAAGGYLVGHDLRNDTAVYGFFAYVLGLVAWIYLAARVFVLSAEINVVRKLQLWPRSISPPPLTPADERALELQALVNRRRSEQTVHVTWRDADIDEEPSGERARAAPGGADQGAGDRSGRPPAGGLTVAARDRRRHARVQPSGAQRSADA
jgi:membrane protein